MSWTLRWRSADFSSRSATSVDPADGGTSRPQCEAAGDGSRRRLTSRRGRFNRKALPRNVIHTSISYLMSEYVPEATEADERASLCWWWPLGGLGLGGVGVFAVQMGQDVFARERVVVSDSCVFYHLGRKGLAVLSGKHFAAGRAGVAVSHHMLLG